MSVRSHDDYRENIGPYVLGALPELEAEILERHLAGCETCRGEVEELRPVTGALARSVPQMEPPPSLKASLMATVREEAALRDPEGARAARRPERRALPRWLGGLQPRMAAAGALAVLALGVVIGVAADKSSRGPGAHTVAAHIDRKLMPTGAASLRVSSNERDATLRLTNAPAPPSGKAYQLWVQRGRTIVRGPTFAPGVDGSVDQAVPGGVRDADAVMVTVEKAGGAPAPTGPPIMRISV